VGFVHLFDAMVVEDLNTDKVKVPPFFMCVCEQKYSVEDIFFITINLKPSERTEVKQQIQ